MIATATNTLVPVLASIIEALPGRLIDHTTGINPCGSRGNSGYGVEDDGRHSYCNLTYFATLDVVNNKVKLEMDWGNLWCADYMDGNRARFYKVREDGTINTKRIFALVKERKLLMSKEAQKRNRERTKDRKERREAGYMAEISHSSIHPGKNYIVENDDHYVGGLRIRVKRQPNGAQTLWCKYGGYVDGALPLQNVAIATLNKIIKLLEKESR